MTGMIRLRTIAGRLAHPLLLVIVYGLPVMGYVAALNGLGA